MKRPLSSTRLGGQNFDIEIITRFMNINFRKDDPVYIIPNSLRGASHNCLESLSSGDIYFI